MQCKRAFESQVSVIGLPAEPMNWTFVIINSTTSYDLAHDNSTLSPKSSMGEFWGIQDLF